MNLNDLLIALREEQWNSRPMPQCTKAMALTNAPRSLNGKQKLKRVAIALGELSSKVAPPQAEVAALSASNEALSAEFAKARSTSLFLPGLGCMGAIV